MSTVREKFSMPVLLGLAIAGAGVVSPVLWDWWSKKAQLTVEVSSVTSVVSSAEPIQKLEFWYAGQKIENLNQVILEVTNSGRMPVTADDVVVPLGIAFGEASVLEARIVGRVPSDLDARLSISRNILRIESALLNSGDSFRVVALTTDAAPSVSAKARIRGVGEINLIRVQRDEGAKLDTWIAVLSIGFIFFVFFSAGLVAFKEGLKKNRAMVALREKSFTLFACETAEQALSTARKELNFLSGLQVISLGTEVGGAQWPLDTAAKEALSSGLVKIVKKEPSWGIFFFSLPVATLAAYFLWHRVPTLM